MIYILCIKAKNIGEIVKRARETIQHYKCIIEKDRRDIAIKSVARGDKDEEIQNQVEVKIFIREKKLNFGVTQQT